MNDRAKILDRYWLRFLAYLQTDKDDTELQALIITKSLEDIFWFWYADNIMPPVRPKK